MKIAMANDHAGTRLKEEIKKYLESEGHEVKDFGTYDEVPTNCAASLPLSARTRSAQHWRASIMTPMYCAWAARLSAALSRWKR